MLKTLITIKQTYENISTTRIMVSSLPFYSNLWHWISARNLLNPQNRLHTITNCVRPALRTTLNIGLDFAGLKKTKPSEFHAYIPGS